ncbi:MAG: L-threonylcarbamoyladenylate synthase [Flavobacteriales bacterium]|jgi:L-threonylcarbamoyladenylate synthase|nr:L-threonylcarbamoyladenylate synthase [Flavobacteriales bacterium]
MAEIGTDILQAARLLKAGKLVSIPTETVYGLAANAFDEDAVINIFEAKNRPHFDPLIVHISGKRWVTELVREIPPLARNLMNEFWPGPLTLVLPKKDVIPDIVTSGLDNVAIRVPAHSVTQGLISNLNFPLAAPSANPFGYVSPTTAQHVNDQLGDKIDYILDGGSTTVGLESTIIGFEDDQPVVYRLGGLSIDVIEDSIGKVKVTLNQSADPKAPGMLKSHYATKKPFHFGNPGQMISDFEEKRIGFLGFITKLEFLPEKQQLLLSPSGDLHEAAKNLFAYMRQFETMNVDLILAEELPDIGLGKAINDRLRRAAV